MSNLVRFDAPVGSAEERAADKLWPGAWFDATGYAVAYPPAMKRSDYHTGADLNCNAPTWNADAHAPVYAVCLGFVAFAGMLQVWGKVVVVQHALEDGRLMWSRYAHLEKMTVKMGQLVQRGDQIGTIGNAEGRQAWHLHFDMAWIDLGRKPGDWPNTDRARLLRTYVDPLKFIRERHVV
jgi:murein DD-endopeptidase MepM/ murein hydrolase activator NlpD